MYTFEVRAEFLLVVDLDIIQLMAGIGNPRGVFLTEGNFN